FDAAAVEAGPDPVAGEEEVAEAGAAGFEAVARAAGGRLDVALGGVDVGAEVLALEPVRALPAARIDQELVVEAPVRSAAAGPDPGGILLDPFPRGVADLLVLAAGIVAVGGRGEDFRRGQRAAEVGDAAGVGVLRPELPRHQVAHVAPGGEGRGVGGEDRVRA